MKKEYKYWKKVKNSVQYLINYLKNKTLITSMYLLLIFILPIYSLYLNSDQYFRIIKLVRSNKLLPNQRVRINTILYNSHENYAIKQALLFKYRHYYKCKKISQEEIIQYGRMGLYKAAEKYNGKANFTYYAGMYIDYELKECLSDAYSLSILPKRIRQKSKKNYTTDEIIEYNNLMQVDLRKNIDHWRDNKNHFDKIIYKERLREIWQFINYLEPDIVRIVNLKYDFEFKKVKTNKELSILMACSGETIRKKLKIFNYELEKYLPSLDRL